MDSRVSNVCLQVGQIARGEGAEVFAQKVAVHGPGGSKLGDPCGGDGGEGPATVFEGGDAVEPSALGEAIDEPGESAAGEEGGMGEFGEAHAAAGGEIHDVESVVLFEGE